MRKIRFYLQAIFLTVNFSFSLDAQIVAHFSFDEDSGESEINETSSKISYYVNHYNNDPDRIKGLKGNALRLDGYSTWVELSDFTLPEINDEITIEFWYATESYNAENAGLVHQKEGAKGFAISVNPYGKLVAEFYADGQYYVINSSQRIEKYKWNHIVFQIDLPNAKAQLYVNGKTWQEKITASHTTIDLNNDLTYIGRSHLNKTFAGFPLTVANGVIDELTFYNVVLADSTLKNNYNQYAHMEVDLSIDPNIRHADDYLRPRYHAMPSTSWTNESYGFTYHKEKYHLFFQKNPNAPTLHFMHWGHLSSPDLVNWTEENIVLAPKEGFASQGTWSGTTFFDDNNEPVIAYTGVNGAIAAIGMAFPADSSLNEWMLYEDNPVIPSAPKNVNHLDFRDPYVWKEDDHYFMVVGSGLQNKGGGILFTYTSNDLINWVNVPAIYSNPDASIAGIFWEMPYFNKINDTDYLLVVTPLFNSKPAQTIYWIGSFDGRYFTPYEQEPKRFEHISRHLLSPAIGLDEENRLSYCGIIPEDRDVALQVASGWRHVFSIPRVLWIKDKSKILSHIPHPNLCRARRNEVVVENRPISFDTNFNLPEYQGSQSELYFKLFTPEVEDFKIEVFKNEASTQLTSITFNKEEQTVGINRVLSSTFQTVENIRKADYNFNLNDTIEVSVFLDHSILEVFVDNSIVISARVYPSRGSELIDIKKGEKGNLEIVEYRAWDIVDKEVLSPIEVCEISNLENEVSTAINEVIQEKDILPSISPNPASDKIYFDKLKANSHIYIFDLNGRVYSPNIDGQSIDISSLSSGVYAGAIVNGKTVRGFKFVKM